jgi:hypothetical protein
MNVKIPGWAAAAEAARWASLVCAVMVAEVEYLTKGGTDVQTESLLGAWSIRKCCAATGDEDTRLFSLRKLYHRLLKALPEQVVLS